MIKIKLTILIFSIFFVSIRAHAQQKICLEILDSKGKEINNGIQLYVNGEIPQILFCYNLDSTIKYIEIRKIGYHTQILPKNLMRAKTKIFLMEETDVLSIDTVRITKDVINNEFGKMSISGSLLKKMPFILGEADAIKSVQILPGVSTAYESNTSLYIRGSNADNNTILMDGIRLRNTGHFFGFFSSYDANLINNYELIKGHINGADNLNGSALLKLNTNTANFGKNETIIEVGQLTSKVLVKLAKNDKFQWTFNARLFYPLMLFTSEIDKTFGYDAFSSLNYQINSKSDLKISLIIDYENMGFTDFNTYINPVFAISKFKYGNKGGSMTYNYRKNEMRNFKVVLSSSTYITDNELNNGFYPIIANNLSLNQRNQMTSILFHNEAIRFKKFKIDYGAEIRKSIYNPYDTFIDYKFLSPSSNQRLAIVNQSHSISVFGNASHTWNNKNSILLSSRMSYYAYTTQPYAINYYIPEFSASFNSLTKTGNNYITISKTATTDNLISNTQIPLVTDLRLMSNSILKPQSTMQYATGKKINWHRLSINIDVYYKTQMHAPEIKPGTVIIFDNRNIYENVVNAKSRAFGFELFLTSTYKKATFINSYTFSRAHRKSAQINYGNRYSAGYDRPHILNSTVIIKLSKKVTLTSNLIFQNGTPITIGPMSNGLYSMKNEFRLPNYYRVDLNFQKQVKIGKLKGAYALNIYNLTNSKNIIAFNNFESNISSLPFLPTLNFKIYL
jgi:hypothetical protein